MRTRFLLLMGGLATVVLACSGPKQKDANVPVAASSAVASSATSEPKTDKPAPKAESKPDKQPRDVITDAETTFVLAFDSSDPGKAADTKCNDSSKGDKKKFNQCMTTARDKIAIDAVRFKADDEKIWWWFSLRRRGGAETVLHKVQIEFGEETDTSIVLKTKGRDAGGTPWANVPKELKVDVPNTFSISLKDPQHGTMVYEAKILLSEKK
jgi:hypothetical protein